MNIQKEISKIKERNQRVELDKAWETSLARKLILSVMTYIVIVLFFIVADLPKPFVNPLVPTLGFLISTLTLPFFKRMWIRARREK